MSASRLVCVTALALALMAGASASAQAGTQDGAIEVIAMIYAPGVAPQEDAATISDLEAGCQTTTSDPAQYGPNGSPEPGTQPSAQEWSLSTVFSQCLPTPIPISSITQVTVLESNGQPDLNNAAQLTAADLSPQGDFPDGTVPVFWDAGSTVIYERPSRGSTDDNVQDSVTVESGENLQFDVFENESPVNVTITPSATTVEPGETVSFTATAPGDPSDETYTWNVDGAVASANGLNTSIRPKQSGSYYITVQATGTEVGFGSLQIKVGSPPTTTGTNTTTGPAKSSGTTPGTGAGKPKPGTGATRPKPTPKPKPKTKPAPQPKATTTPAAGSSPSNQAAAGAGTAGLTQTGSGAATTTSPAVSAVVPTTTAPATKTKTVPTRTRTTATASAPTQTPTPKVPPASGPAATHTPTKDVRVQGRLLGGVVALSSSPARLTKQTPQGSAPQLDKPGGGNPWPAIGLALGVLALLGLGATRELRSIRSEL